MMSKSEKAIRLLIQLASLGATLYTGWLLIPEHQRKQILMSSALHAGEMSRRTAQVFGAAGMSEELSGNSKEATFRYRVAYWLMNRYNQSQEAYERLRES